MRVTEATSHRNFMYNIMKTEQRLIDLQNQASSGRRIMRPQDDPVGAERAVGLRHHLARNEQYLRNIHKARTWMEETEQALSHLTSVLSRSYELGVQAANSTLPDEARLAIASEVEQLLHEVTSIRDTTVEGRKLLVGTLPSWQVGEGTEVAVEDLSTLFDQVSASVQRLHQGLIAPSPSEVHASVSDISSALDQVLAQRAANGAKLRRMDVLEEKMRSLDIEYKRLLSNVEDIDLTEIIVRLRSLEASYEAALGVGARMIQPSLLDYLK